MSSSVNTTPTATSSTMTLLTSSTTAPGTSSSYDGSGLQWFDYLEIVVLVIACVLGLVGNLTVLRASYRIRTFSRQISYLYSALVVADVLICGSRIPTSLFIVISHPPEALTLVAATPRVTVTGIANTVTSAPEVSLASSSLAPRGSAGGAAVVSDGGGGAGGATGTAGSDVAVDIACEVWAASMGLLLTVIWLHLVIGFQRLAIIFSFMKYRKLFTTSLALFIVLAAFFLGLVIVYTPLRALGLPMERAGRGACRVHGTAPEGVLIARSVTTSLLCLLPLLMAVVCHLIVMRSVWIARDLEVRTGATTEYNRVVVVGVVRILTLLLSYLPVCVLYIVDVQGVTVPDAAHRYVGHFLWLQSVVSPFVTLQDNDFRDKMMVPNQHAPSLERNGVHWEVAPGETGAGAEGGGQPAARRERAAQEGKKERRKLQRGISFITSADLRSIKGSSD